MTMYYAIHEEMSAARELATIVWQDDDDEVKVISGADANGLHSEEDIDDEHFQGEGAQAQQAALSEMWACFVRAAGLRATNSWTSERSTRGTWTLRHADREGHVE